MINYLHGKLTVKEPGIAVVECGGVGYKTAISKTTFEALPPVTTYENAVEILLYTHMAVREDGVELFGFASKKELNSFKLLIGVSGVGPKVALSVLSHLNPEEFAIAVGTEDAKTISGANGVGLKTAQRIVLELKDKILKENGLTEQEALLQRKASGGNTSQMDRTKIKEATDALLVLGYSKPMATKVLSQIDCTSLSLEEIIKSALKKLAQ